MDQENNKKENIRDTKEGWIEKTEKFIDAASEKIHKSETYRKADQSVEKATKKIFRKSGRWWGKTEQYFKNQSEEKKDESK
jgi:HEPN domain-containing protein